MTTNSKASRRLDDYWKIDYNQELGRGKFGDVYRGYHLMTLEEVAIKVIPKSFNTNHIDQLKIESDCLNILSSDDVHPNIVRLLDVFEDELTKYLVLELCEGVELFDEINSRYMEGEGFTEPEVKELMWVMFHTIRYLHRKGITHRDLKPENFRYNPSNKSLKMLDFGLSQSNSNNLDMDQPVLSRFRSPVGSPPYMAPEVIRKNYTQNCDNWSAGVIFYVLFCGYPPFYGATDRDVFDNIKHGTLYFGEDFRGVSEEAKDLIKQLLNRDETARLTATDALQHPWFGGFQSKWGLTGVI